MWREGFVHYSGRVRSAVVQYVRICIMRKLQPAYVVYGPTVARY